MGSRGRADATTLQGLPPMREGPYLESSEIPPSSSDSVTEQLLVMHLREMDRRHREEIAALNAKHEEAVRHILRLKALESQSLNAPLSAVRFAPEEELPSHTADASAAPAVAIAQQERMVLARDEAVLMAQLANGLAAAAAAEAADVEAIKSEAIESEAAEAEAIKTEAAKAEAIQAEAEMAAWDSVAVEKAAAQKVAAQKAASDAAEAEATTTPSAVAMTSDALRWSPEIEMASGKELASSWTPQQVASARRTSVLADRLVAAFNDAEDDDRRILALNSLYEAAHDAYGADAAATAAAVRKGGAIDGLTKCIESNSAELQQLSLALLGNLLTDAFDASARLSLALFVESGGLFVLLRVLHAEHPLVVFTLAALQNVTSLGSRQICLKVRELGFDKELIVLKKALKDEDETVSDYITAVLSNLRLLAPDTATVDSDPALEEAIRMRRLKSVAKTIKSLNAATMMQRLGRRWIRRHRAKPANKAKAAEAAAADGKVAAGAEAAVEAETIAEQDAAQLSNGEEAFAEATSDAPAMSGALAAVAAAFGLPALLAVLRKKSSSDEDQGDALRQLAQVVNDSYDSEAVALCEYLRAAGGVKLIVRLLRSPIPTVHQMAIMLVGNLASLAVDPHATKSKDVLKAEGAFSLLLPYMFSEDDMTLAYTLGALQNLCTEIEYVEQLEKAGGLERLQALIERKDRQLESFVRGCLSNVRTTKVRTTAATLSAPSKCPILVLSEYLMCPSDCPYDCPSECRWWRPSSGASRSVNTSQPLPCRRMPADGWRVTARGSSARNWMRH
jgi:hypothetical protein